MILNSYSLPMKRETQGKLQWLPALVLSTPEFVCGGGGEELVEWANHYPSSLTG